MSWIRRGGSALVFFLVTFSFFSEARAGFWEDIKTLISPPTLSFPAPSGDNTPSGPTVNACAPPDQNAPHDIIRLFCNRMAACLPPEEASSARTGCIWRLTGDEGKELWSAMGGEFADAPTAAVLARYIDQGVATVNATNYCSCTKSLNELSCEAVQSRINSADYGWASGLVAAQESCTNVFTGSGPLTAKSFQEKGAIHVFARILDDSGKGVLGHWQGLPGSKPWGEGQYWFHQIPMELDRPPTVVYHKAVNAIDVLAYRDDSPDIGGAGSLHVTRCYLDGFTKNGFDCTAEAILERDQAHYNPAAVSWGKDILVYFYHGGDKGLRMGFWYPFSTNALTGAWSGQVGSDCEDRGIQLSPGVVAEPLPDGSQKIHVFARSRNNGLFYVSKIFPPISLDYDPNALRRTEIDDIILETARGEMGGLWSCEIFSRSTLPAVLSSPTASFIPPWVWNERYTMGLYVMVYFISSDNFLGNMLVKSGEVKSAYDGHPTFPTYRNFVSMSPENRVGVVTVDALSTGEPPEDYVRYYDIVGFRNSQGQLSMFGKRRPNQEEDDKTPILDSPAMALDAENNIHFFSGELGGPNAINSRTALHHIVRPRGKFRDGTWMEPKTEGASLFPAKIQHTDDGRSAPAALYVPPRLLVKTIEAPIAPLLNDK